MNDQLKVALCPICGNHLGSAECLAMQGVFPRARGDGIVELQGKLDAAIAQRDEARGLLKEWVGAKRDEEMPYQQTRQFLARQ